MSDSGGVPPAAKRQRTSYSPASSTSEPVKPGEESRHAAGHPETPSSPPLTSSGSYADVVSSTPQFYAFTPPASAPMSAEPSQQPFVTLPNPPPPAQLPIDLAGLPQADFDANISMTNTRDDSTLHTPPTEQISQSNSIPTDGELKRTNHDRNEITLVIDPSGPSALNESDGALYKLNENSYPAVEPGFSQNLFELYGLSEIAAGVARYNLTTGAKTPLRKSYQNFISDISGRNKPVAKPREFLDLLHYGDDDWLAQKVAGKEIEKGLSPEKLAKLDQAVKMEPGKLPKDENDKWRNILDLDDEQAKGFAIQATISKSATSKPSRPANVTVTPTTEPPRLSRRGTKRRYNDDAFEGYGEGYMDDVGDSPGADQDDEDNRGSAKKKRRRDTGGASSPSFSESLAPYGANSISVGSGSYNGR